MSRLNISSGWCWGHMPDSLGYRCPRHCSEIKLETSHSSDVKQLCTKSMTAGHSPAQPPWYQKCICWAVQALKEQSAPWEQWDPHSLEGVSCALDFHLLTMTSPQSSRFNIFLSSIIAASVFLKSYSKSDVWCENQGTDTAKLGLLRLRISTVAQTRTENAAEHLLTSQTLLPLNQNHVGSRKAPNFVSRSYMTNRFTLG